MAGGAVRSSGSRGGVDVIRGIAFQLAQALSDVIDVVAEGDGDAVTIEGAADVVDYEVLDRTGRRIAVRQAKTRREPGTWGARELAPILCAFGEVENAADAEFAFVTDAPLNASGQRLDELIKAMRAQPDEALLRSTATSLARGGVQLPPLDVVRRVQILTRMGTTDSVLARATTRILTLLSRARLATLEDAENAVNALFRRLFVIGGTIDLEHRTISRADVLAALGLSEANLRGGVGWSRDIAAAYRAAVLEDSRRPVGFVPLHVVPVASAPRVLRFVQELGRDDKSEREQSLDSVLEEQSAALVGATGQGKTRALMYLASVAAQRGLVPVVLHAAGHMAGALPRRVRYSIEALLGQSLTAGAVEHVLADPGLLLLLDGVSEVDPATRAALAADLQQLRAQRPVQLVAAGRDFPLTIAGAALPGNSAVFRMRDLDHGSRGLLAATHGVHNHAVLLIEHRLGDAVGNPMLFLMALSLADTGVPESRAEVYRQFLQGLAALAGVSDDDVGLAAVGAAWAQLIARDLRAADHYTWRSVLGATLEGFALLPTWRGHSGTAEGVLELAQRVGLLTRLDSDSGLAPLHDSFADFLAARAIARGETGLPARLNTSYDETVLFVVEMGGLNDTLADRLATENPLLACRVARLRQARGRADAERVGWLLQALAAGRDLPLLGPAGVRVFHHESVTGAVLAGNGHATVGQAEFDALIREHPAVIVPAHTGSLQLAVGLWAAAITRACRPGTKVFQPAPRPDTEAAIVLLPAYLREVERELHRFADTCLPGTVRDRVLAAVEPRGIVAYVSDPVPGHLGALEVPVRYRRSSEYVVTRACGQETDDARQLTKDTLAEMMRLHPAQQAANEIGRALSVLTHNAWPEP
jgi:hypothetical protein